MSELLQFFCSQEIRISNFASLYEIFLGFGFGFYALSALKMFIENVIKFRDRADAKILSTIEAIKGLKESIEKITKQVENSATVSEQVQTELVGFQVAFPPIEKDVYEQKNFFVQKSRFYFLTLGVYCFSILVYCGFEEGFVNQAYYSDCLSVLFYFSLIFIIYMFSIYFETRRPIIINEKDKPLQKENGISFFHNFLNYHEKSGKREKERGVITELAKAVLIFSVSIQLSRIIIIPIQPFFVACLSIMILVLPFILFVQRHRLYTRYLEDKDYLTELNNLYQKLSGVQETLEINQNPPSA